MTSWNGGEDEAHDDEPEEGPQSLRDSVGSAEPSPVTDAMIRPRTSPGTSAGSVVPADDGESPCRVCGEVNQEGATYCLGCGIRLTPSPVAAVPDEEPEPWVDDDDLEFDHDAGLIDLDEAVAPPADISDETPPVPPTPRDIGAIVRRAVAGLIALVVVFLLVTTFVNGSNDADATTTTTLAPDLVALDAYQTELAGIAATVASLKEAALEANAAWEDRTVDFDATLSALSSIESQAAALPDLVSAMSIPEAIGSATHIRIISSAETLAEAATEMVEGLRAPDTGELRQAALAKFDAAAVEFASLTRVVDQAVASIRSEPTE